VNEKAEPNVRPLGESLTSELILQYAVRVTGQREALYSEIEKHWGNLDFVLHSIAFAPEEDLHARVIDCSQAGFCRGRGTHWQCRIYRRR